MAPSLSHTHSLLLSPSAAQPGTERNRPGSVSHRAVGEGTGPGTPADRAWRKGGRLYLCQGELGRRSHGVSIMHGRGRKDWRMGAQGGEEAEGAAKGEARASERASPLTSTTSLLSPAPPLQAPPTRRRQRRCPNTGSGFTLPDRSLPPGRLGKPGAVIKLKRTGLQFTQITLYAGNVPTPNLFFGKRREIIP